MNLKPTERKQMGEFGGLSVETRKRKTIFAVFRAKTTKFANKKMKDYNDIAKQYAERNGYSFVRPSAERSGYRYFYVDYADRPRYLGHPHIIKISPAGKVQRVLNVNEICWAVKHLKPPLTRCSYEKALRIAVDAHNGQTDKAGEPYILHPIRVAKKCATEEERIVAILHDVIEDTAITPEDLRSEGFPKIIIEAVLSVTRLEDEDYFDFIKRCKLNPIGRVVKIRDLEDNMDITRLNSLAEEDFARLNKYLKAYKYLTK